MLIASLALYVAKSRMELIFWHFHYSTVVDAFRCSDIWFSLV
ncbi:hypothetical protein SOVF_099010 [Spinacia oleracea]|nr:hypothetical protein SOVF_099010 [Spinacia oleracea]